MEIKLTKMEIAMILSGLGRNLKRNKDQQSKFIKNLEIGYYERFNSKQKRNIRKNKAHKIEVINNLIGKLEISMDQDEVNLILSEIDFDYSELKYTELNDKSKTK